jgi:hypothetical protein
MMGHPDVMGEWSRLAVIADRRRARRHLIGAAVVLGLALLALEKSLFVIF